MQGDWEGASLQYRTASALLKTAHIDEHSGSITRATDGAPSPEPGLPSRMRGAPAQLVCFISIGSASPGYRSRAAGRAHEHPEYARLFADDIYLGRSHRLTNVPHLRRKTEKVLKKRQKAKRAARIAIKEAAAQLVSQEDEALGDILRLLLFSLETDDSRRWETLPRDLHVARVACPVEPSEFRIALYDVRGRKIAEQALTSPIVRIGNVYGSFLRVF